MLVGIFSIHREMERHTTHTRTLIFMHFPTKIRPNLAFQKQQNLPIFLRIFFYILAYFLTYSETLLLTDIFGVGIVNKTSKKLIECSTIPPKGTFSVTITKGLVQGLEDCHIWTLNVSNSPDKICLFAMRNYGSLLDIYKATSLTTFQSWGL